MMPADFNVLEQITKPHGFEFNLHEAFRKLATSQFGGNPGRGFCELIQNAIDSYPLNVPLPERKVEIRTSPEKISIRDEGEGMTIERLNLLATLGGTDKDDCPQKIGKFGMGFFSIFNPNLQTSKVQVRTLCDSRIVVLDFVVDETDPTKLPQLRTKLLRKGSKSWRGSEITVHFRSHASVEICWLETRKFVRYFPSPVFINGELFAESVWEEARRSKASFFEEPTRHGFLKSNDHRHSISVLCKYEQIMHCEIAVLSSGGHNMTGDLRDFKKRGVPYVPGTFTLVNDNHLNVTVSRDSIRMDQAYAALVKSVAVAHINELRQIISRDSASPLVLANQFVFAGQIHCHLGAPQVRDTDPVSQAIVELADCPVYRLAGQDQKVSLRYIWDHRSRGNPVFFSPGGLNVTWLGGAFEHDFIVLPPDSTILRPSDGFYDQLFFEVFGDAVNLRTIRENKDLIQTLVRRGIVQPELLSPKCKLMGGWEATEEEQCFLAEINEILALPQVGDMIQQNLHLSTPAIQATLFSVQDGELVIATGLFQNDGQAYRPVADQTEPAKVQRELKLGLMRTHPLIQHLIQSADPHRAFYTLTFLAHQLVNCQRLLVPDSSFRNWLVSKLGRNLREVLVDVLLANNA